MTATPQRIAVFGPESTGKTELARCLAEHFGEPWAPEFVREFWDRNGGSVRGGDLDEIARGQIRGEDEAAARARRVVFADTELLTNVLWADLLFPGECPEWIRLEAERRCRTYALYLLCRTDLDYVPDPQRCFPDEAGRAMCMRRWTESLQTRRVPYVWVQGRGPERFARAVDAVNAVLKKGAR